LVITIDLNIYISINLTSYLDHNYHHYIVNCDVIKVCLKFWAKP